MPAPDPRDYERPLNWWGHLWRILAAAAISAAAWAELAIWQWKNDPAWFFADLALGIVAMVAMQYRRRFPVAVNVGLLVATLVSGAATGASVVALASLATRRRWREILPVAVLSVIASQLTSMIYPTVDDPWYLTFGAAVSITAICVGWGMYIGSRRELLVTLEDRARTAEAEQAMRVAQARTAERSRLAREMHDVLAHRISMVAMHAGALTYRTGLPADEIKRVSAVIEENAHQALVDLREVLGILREDSEGVPHRPQPNMGDLPDLIDEAHSARMNVEYKNALEGVPLSENVGRTTYRIVQEALTNARKHAPDTTVSVQIFGDQTQGIRVEVSNPTRIGARRSAAPPSGLGLLGLAERVALSGGSLTHQVTDDRQFVVTAQIPWPT